MHRLSFIVILTVAVLSCQKAAIDEPSLAWSGSDVLGQEEIVLSIEALEGMTDTKGGEVPETYTYTEEDLVITAVSEPLPFEFVDGPGTKTTAITSVPSSLYWGATTGGNSSGTSSETVKYSKSTATTSSNKIYTGRYQTRTASTYNYYVTNCPNMYITSSSYITVPNNNTDYLAGRRYGSSSATPSVTLEHVFGRTGTFSLITSNDQGYTFDNITLSIQSNYAYSGTAGTYNLRSRSWTSRSAALPLTVLGSNVTTVSTDMYLIPTYYWLYISYRVHNGTKYLDFTKRASIYVSKGKRTHYNIYIPLVYSWEGAFDDSYDDEGQINL